MALDFGNKVANGGTTPQGILAATEFNKVVQAINANEQAINNLDADGITTTTGSSSGAWVESDTVQEALSGLNSAKGNKVKQVTVDGTTPVQELAANTFYVFGSVESLEVSLGAGEAGAANVWAFRFTAGVDNPAVTLPAGVVCNDDLSLSAGDVCEFSIMDNLAVFAVWEAS